jgi:hypothetical protein
MKIKLFVPYFNEQMLARINILSAIKWVDEIHLTESNFTFQGKPKEYNFDLNSYANEQLLSKINYHSIDFANHFLFKRKIFPHFLVKNKPKWHLKVFFNTSWFNEGIQRNFSCNKSLINDEDIIILSDVDEIIDPRQMELILSEVKKHKIVTIRLHFSLFYFNLFSSSWGGPSDYSYRVFIMTGDEFKKLNYDYDTLRKKGERNQLGNSIYCIPEICGFHHSWIGNKDFIKSKLAAYAHVEHNKLNDGSYISDCLKNGVSIFENHKVHVDNSIDFLEEIKNNKETYQDYFFK